MKNRMRELRQSRNFTQEQLSEQVGVSRQTIISLENGRYKPSLELAYKISKVFNCIIEEVFIFNEGGNEDK